MLIASCGKEDDSQDDNDPLPCEICGFYQGFSDGMIEISLTQTDTTFLGIPTTVQVSENQTTNDYIIILDHSALLGDTLGSFELEMYGFITGNTLTIPNQNYQYAGLSTIAMSGTMDFLEVDSTTASFTFTDDAVATINFSGTK